MSYNWLSDEYLETAIETATDYSTKGQGAVRHHHQRTHVYFGECSIRMQWCFSKCNGTMDHFVGGLKFVATRYKDPRGIIESSWDQGDYTHFGASPAFCVLTGKEAIANTGWVVAAQRRSFEWLVSTMDRGRKPYFFPYPREAEDLPYDIKDHAPHDGGANYREVGQRSSEGYNIEHNRPWSIEVGVYWPPQQSGEGIWVTRGWVTIIMLGTYWDGVPGVNFFQLSQFL